MLARQSSALAFCHSAAVWFSGCINKHRIDCWGLRGGQGEVVVKNLFPFNFFYFNQKESVWELILQQKWSS